MSNVNMTTQDFSSKWKADAGCFLVNEFAFYPMGGTALRGSDLFSGHA